MPLKGLYRSCTGIERAVVGSDVGFGVEGERPQDAGGPAAATYAAMTRRAKGVRVEPCVTSEVVCAERMWRARACESGPSVRSCLVVLREHVSGMGYESKRHSLWLGEARAHIRGRADKRPRDSGRGKHATRRVAARPNAARKK